MRGKNKQKRHPSCLEWRLMLFGLVGICSRGRTSRTSAGHHRTKSKSASCWRRCRFFVFLRRLRKRAFDASLECKKIAQHPLCDLLLFRDSVGIRTQDPQLRRLLLYPTELPNRSLCFLAEKFALCPKESAKIVIIFGYAKLIGTPC